MYNKVNSEKTNESGCDFVVLFTQLLYVFFLQDVFTMFSGEPMGAVGVFMT